jgi:hypothetical protein
LETICLKCLQKEPRQRYATAAALAEDLRLFGREEPIRGRRPGLLARMGRWCRAPERIRDAAVMGRFNGFIMTTLALNAIPTALVGLYFVERWLPAAACLVTCIALSCTLLWISRHTSPPNRRTLWIGVVVPWLFPLYVLASMSGAIDTGGLVNYQDPSMSIAWLTVILLIYATTILAYALALAAYYANRHRPGFVPEEEKMRSEE